MSVHTGGKQMKRCACPITAFIPPTRVEWAEGTARCRQATHRCAQPRQELEVFNGDNEAAQKCLPEMVIVHAANAACHCSSGCMGLLDFQWGVVIALPATVKN